MSKARQLQTPTMRHITALIAFLLASVAAASAQSVSTPTACIISSAKSGAADCCTQAYSFTTTSYTTCGACIASSTTIDPKCAIVRCGSPTTLPGTTTITACSTASPACSSACALARSLPETSGTESTSSQASGPMSPSSCTIWTTSNQSKVRQIVPCDSPTTLTSTTLVSSAATSKTPSATSPASGPSSSASCTSTITSTASFGCTITVAPTTTTSSIDCAGCVLETATVANEMFNHGPVCVDGRKTVTASTGVATSTACFTSGGL